MEDYVLAFAADPDAGPASVGWAEYATGQMPRFGADGQVVQNISVNAVDGACFGGSYNPTP